MGTGLAKGRVPAWAVQDSEQHQESSCFALKSRIQKSKKKTFFFFLILAFRKVNQLIYAVLL